MNTDETTATPGEDISTLELDDCLAESIARILAGAAVQAFARDLVHAVITILWEDGVLTGEGLVAGIDLGFRDPVRIVEYVAGDEDLMARFVVAGNEAIDAYLVEHPEARVRGEEDSDDEPGEAPDAGQG